MTINNALSTNSLRPSVLAAVYLGSKNGSSPIYCKCASELAKQLAQRKIGIVYGGANVGTMKYLADSAIKNNSYIIGVFPKGFKGKEEVRLANIEIEKHNLNEIIYTKDLCERKIIMEQLSNFCIILPGSLGTLDEFAQYAVNKQLKFHNKRLYILNINNFFLPLKLLLDNMVKEEFMPEGDLSSFIFCNSIDQILSNIDSFEL